MLIKNGINALDLIDSEPLNSIEFTKSCAMLQANYGTEYSQEKMSLLYSMMKDEGWSLERFNRTVKWFIKNKPFPAWTVADWFQYGVKLYPHEWYMQQQSEAGIYTHVIESMDVYLIGMTTMYRWKDGEDLPLPRHPDFM